MDKENLKLSDDSTDRFCEYVRMRYQEESTKPNSLNTRVSIMLTATTLLAAIMGQLVTKFPIGESGWHVWFYIVMGSLLIPTVTITYNFIYFFWGFKYGYPPDEGDILEQFHDFRVYFNVNYDQYYKHLGSKEVVLSRAEKWALCEKLMVCIKADHKANTSKSAALLSIGRSLVVAFVLIIIAYVLKQLIG